MRKLLALTLITLSASLSHAGWVTFELRNDTPCPSDTYDQYLVCNGVERLEGQSGYLDPWQVLYPQRYCEGSDPIMRLKFINSSQSNYGRVLDITPDLGSATASAEVFSSCNSVTNDGTGGDGGSSCKTGCCGGAGGAGGGGSAPPCSTCQDQGTTEGDGGGVGMPQWQVSEPFINLWIRDEPLGYQPATGSRISFRLAFKQREISTGMDTNIFSTGKKWNFSWLSYITKDANGTNAALFSGGGRRSFTNGQDYVTRGQLSGNTNSGFTVSYPNGSKDVYGFILTNTAGTFIKAFMTERWNSQSQKTSLYYSSYNPTNAVIRLQYVVDADGRTNLIYYNNTNLYSTNLIGQVVDAFGRVATLAYDAGGHLTGITDVAGMSSSLGYDTNDWVSSLTTPYGTTGFNITDTSGTNLIPNGRSILISQPDGGHQLYLYRDSAPGVPWSYPTNEVPNTSPFSNTFENSEMKFRNSFHWGARQYTLLSTTNVPVLTTNDFQKARLSHWLKDDYFTVGETISMQQDPSPDNTGSLAGQKTWYDYAGKKNTQNIGAQPLPLTSARILPDTTSSFARTDRNFFGSTTTNIGTFSVSTNILFRTNIFTYASDGVDLLTVTNALGVQVSSNSYSAHQVLTNYNALGEKTVCTYNSTHELTSILRPSGLITTNIYGANGLPVTTYDYAIIGGSPVCYRTNSYTYTNDLIFTHTDERGVTTTNTWDELQRLRRIDYPDGTFITNTYDKLDLVRTIDRMGFSNSFTFDSIRRKVAETNALGRVTVYNYCTCGSLDSTRDAANDYTYFFYDNQGRLTNTVYADGFAITNRYDLLGRITNSTDTAGTSITNRFNNQGLIIAVSNSFGRVNTSIFDALDRSTNSVDANGVAVISTFDNLDRIRTRTYPDGGVEELGYTPNIRSQTSYTNQLDKVTCYVYDPLNRRTAQTNANLEITQFSYSPAGDLLMLTDGKGQTTSWIYDEYGRATNKLDTATNLVFVYGYDPNGRLTTRWTPAKGTTAYAYDAVGNLTNVDYPSSPDISLAYDVLNRLTNMVDALGTTHYTYDAASQLLSEDGPWNEDTVSYAFTNRLRTSLALLQPNASPWVQTYSYDAAKRLMNVTSLAGAFGYTYDSARKTQVQQLSLPNGAAITNSFDANARLLNTVLINSGLSPLNSNQYSYNPGNQRTQQVFTTGNFVNYNYDNIGQLVSAAGKEAGGTARLQEQLGYYYDQVGNLNRRTNNALVQTFNVNSLNELTTETNAGTLTVAGTTTSVATNVTVSGTGLSSGPADSYGDNTWARAGANWVNGDNTYTATATDSYGRSSSDTVSANLLVTNIFIYDANGNLRTNGNQVLEYDDENQLASITVSNAWRSEFSYDGRMRLRIRKELTWLSSNWTQTNEIHYVYDGNLVIQERWFNPQLSTLTAQRAVSYTRGEDLSGSLDGAGGIGGLLCRTDNSMLAIGDSGASALFHSDANGNVSALINDAQQLVAKYCYDPFGNILSQSGPLADANCYRFSSKEFHANSATYSYLYRFYQPSLQRWLSADPVSEAGHTLLRGQSQSWHLGERQLPYTFVGNNSLDKIDPDGLDFTPPPPGTEIANCPCSGGKGGLTDAGKKLPKKVQDCILEHEASHEKDQCGQKFPNVTSKPGKPNLFGMGDTMCRRAYSEMKAKEAGVACADRSLKDAGLTKDERDALEWYRKQAEAGQKQQLEILKKNCNFP